jgi:hypothetical protein
MSQQLIELLSDITYARAAFFRRHSVIPYHLMRTFLANEDRMLALLTQFSTPAPPPAPRARAPLPPLAHNFDIPLNLVQLLFGRDATVGLGQGQGQNQFWDAVTVGLSTEQFAAGTRNYENPPDVAEQDQCCICQEGITTEAAIHTLCPGPPLGDGVTVTNHHALHRRCAQTWFAISTRCPVCRADLRTLAPTTTNGAPGGEPAAASGGGVHPDLQS